MKNLLLACGLALTLGGCASISNPISTAEIYNLENTYGVVQSLAVGYASQPFCLKGTSVGQSILKFCAIPAAVVEIERADRNARSALQTAEDFVRANPRLSAASLIDAARAAIGLASQIEASYGLKG